MNKVRMKRRVKIVCTLGPASSSSEVMEGLLNGGMDIARLNLAYGTLEEHARFITEIRSLSRKLNLPTGILLDLPGLKRHSGDMKVVFSEHLEFANAQKVDFIALSFISTEQQVKDVRSLLKNMKSRIPVIVKIEQAKALENSKAILEASDGIMVARGDLALEISIEKVPLAQKQLIKEGNHRGKSVITATQMLESMVRSTSPTRAEATDVANAILDGSDALMLSEETAIGSYPIEAVEMMSRIALEAESAFSFDQMLIERRQNILPEVDDAMARAACQIAHQVQAKGILAFTTGGTTALRLSKYRPEQPILAVTPSEACVRFLSLAWGVFPITKPEQENLENIFELTKNVALETEIAGKGDLVVITAGLPLSTPGNTNLVKVHII
ncbi:pyruvate kinase [Chloroflexota bacterium]